MFDLLSADLNGIMCSASRRYITPPVDFNSNKKRDFEIQFSHNILTNISLYEKQLVLTSGH